MRLRVQQVLNKAGIPHRVIRLKNPAINIEDVIAYSEEPINPEEICKTILIKQRNRYIALLLRGRDKIDFKKLKKIIGKARIASLDEVKEVTGAEPGAVCPLLIDVPVLVDVRVLSLKRLNFGSGDPLYGVEISTGDLGRVLEYTVVDVAASIQ